MSHSNSNQISKLYNTVVEDVMTNVKEAFLDEGVDEQVLQDLSQLWLSKLAASKALEPPPEPQITFPPPQAQSNVLLPQQIQATNAPNIQPRPVLQQKPDASLQTIRSQPQQRPQFQPVAASGAAPNMPATISLQGGLYHQQITALGAHGQMQNFTVQQTGNGQYITVAGVSQFPQLQQIQQAQQIGGQPVAQKINIQGHQQPIQIQQQQQAKLIQHPGIGASTIMQQQNNPTVVAGQQVMAVKGQLGVGGRPVYGGKTVDGMIQLDGCADTSSDDDEDFNDDDEKDDDAKDEEEEDPAEEEEPLNSDDDISEEDPTELFDSDNVVVCQYDKIHRNRNKWKFHLKDGIMSLNGRDFVFQKATGDAEW